jgi:hypothetical protein
MYQETRSRLAKIVEKQDEYTKLLEELMLQGFLELLEGEVLVQCCARDVGFVEMVLESARKRYKEMTGLTVEVTIDKVNPLPESAYGAFFIMFSLAKIVNELLNTLTRYACSHEYYIFLGLEVLLPVLKLDVLKSLTLWNPAWRSPRSRFVHLIFSFYSKVKKCAIGMSSSYLKT